MTISQETRDGFAAYSLGNGVLRLVVLPQLGGKIVSFCRLETGHEWVLQPKQPLKTSLYGDDFEASDPAGFDECFPTIKACLYSEGEYHGFSLPDHGELWTAPWKVWSREDAFTMSARGTALPSLFSRSITVGDETVQLHYTLENTGTSAFHYLWSAHPLLRVIAGDRIVLPATVKSLRVESAYLDRLGAHGADCQWPIAEVSGGESRDLSVVHAPDSGWAEKLFTSRMSVGCCAIESHARSEALTFNFDPAEVPFLGLWIKEGGSPAQETQKDFTVALEPCLSPCDSLAEAIANGTSPLIAPAQKHHWSFNVTLSPLREVRA